ncbi:MAG TPA: 4-(cytidine 5'-diphospho)-2-C-methyl-D-erythritol kinase [Pirellulaceae bacterium]|nr:4-(cytidine 5'-diphospho)-2-C-methyl-D-erythritol kinase [Pirellulaceae bacterium]
MLVRSYGSQVAVRTPAKLNLFLEVLGRRVDGYHELETLMVAVALFDSLHFSPREDGEIRLSCRWSLGHEAAVVRAQREGRHAAWDLLPPERTNLVWRAIEKLRQRAGVESGADVQLVKNIPSAAGLGGASSDAAAALLGANQLWNLGWSVEQLADLAAELGSDVPFFVERRAGEAAASVCRGRGEQVEPLDCVPNLHCVLVRPPAGLSTALVFRGCRPAEQPRSVEPLVRALRSGDLAAIGRTLHNRLQEPATELSPWIEKLQATFRRLDVVGHQMSGSGTTYFGICHHATHARRTVQRLRQAGWQAVFYAVAPAA